MTRCGSRLLGFLQGFLLVLGLCVVASAWTNSADLGPPGPAAEIRADRFAPEAPSPARVERPSLPWSTSDRPPTPESALAPLTDLVLPLAVPASRPPAPDDPPTGLAPAAPTPLRV